MKRQPLPFIPSAPIRPDVSNAKLAKEIENRWILQGWPQARAWIKPYHNIPHLHGDPTFLGIIQSNLVNGIPPG